jgi:hypothetical protein
VNPSAVIAEATARGAVLSVSPEGQLRVRTRGPLPADLKALLTTHKAALVVYLSRSAAEPWNPAAALHLMDQADASVEQSGVSGTHPEVWAAAQAVCASYAAKDLAGVRAACRAMTAVVRRLAGDARGSAA